jgi:hypothetical protein
MKNPNGNKFAENDALTEETEFGSDPLKPEAQGRLQRSARKMSDAAADTWEQAKEKATVARQRTELLLRENPVPTVLGALALGRDRLSTGVEDNEPTGLLFSDGDSTVEGLLRTKPVKTNNGLLIFTMQHGENNLYLIEGQSNQASDE